MQDGNYKDYAIAADVPGWLIAAFTGENAVAVAANAAAPFAGITDSVGGKVSHGLVSCQQDQEADVRFGAAVTNGAPLMAASDGTGRAVPLVKPASGASVFCIGFARRAGQADDIGKVWLSPHIVFG